VPDPNGFEGTVRISRAEEPGWTELPESGGYPGAARGYGVADMARAIADGTAHRATATWLITSWTSWSRCSPRRGPARRRLGEHLRASRAGAAGRPARPAVTRPAVIEQ